MISISAKLKQNDIEKKLKGRLKQKPNTQRELMKRDKILYLSI